MVRKYLSIKDIVLSMTSETEKIIDFLFGLVSLGKTTGITYECSETFPHENSIMIGYTQSNDSHMNYVMNIIIEEIKKLERDSQINSILNKIKFEILPKFSVFVWEKNFGYEPSNIYFLVLTEQQGDEFKITKTSIENNEITVKNAMIKAIEFEKNPQNRNQGKRLSLVAKTREEKLLVIDFEEVPDEHKGVVFSRIYKVTAEFIKRPGGRDIERSWTIPFILVKNTENTGDVAVQLKPHAGEMNIDNIEKNKILTAVCLAKFKKRGMFSSGLFELKGTEFEIYTVIPKNNTQGINFDERTFKKIVEPFLRSSEIRKLGISLIFDDNCIFVNRIFAELIFGNIQYLLKKL